MGPGRLQLATKLHGSAATQRVRVGRINKAKDRHGREFRVKGEELFARALQHEIDHLNGILYIDYLESLEELVRVSETSTEVTEETTAGI